MPLLLHNKSFLLFILSILIFLTACEVEEIQILIDPYKEHTRELQNVVYRDRLSFGLGTSDFIPFEKYGYEDPSFNPNNPYQIVYIRKRQDSLKVCEGELFTFDFESGITKKLADNACAYTSWSRENWIAYWGPDCFLWKVKSDGDSLQCFGSTIGIHDLHWAPDGSKLLGMRGQFAHIFDFSGKLIFKAEDYYVPMNWIDNDHILVGHAPGGRDIALLNIHSRTVQKLIDSPISRSLFFNPVRRQAFSVTPTAPEFWLVKLDVINKEVDTISREYASFRPIRGDFHPQTNQAIMGYRIFNIKDSLRDQLYFRNHLILYDLETGERKQVVLPE